MISNLLRRHMPRELPSLLCLVFLSAQAQAQPTSTALRPDPLDAKATVPALSYESAMAQYRRLSEERVVSWREANEAVARIGGWRVYAREAQQAAPPGPALPAAKPPSGMPADMTHKPMPAGHGDHKKP